MEARVTFIEALILIIVAIQLFLIIAFIWLCIQHWDDEDDDKKGGGRNDIQAL